MSPIKPSKELMHGFRVNLGEKQVALRTGELLLRITMGIKDGRPIDFFFLHKEKKRIQGAHGTWNEVPLEDLRL